MASQSTLAITDDDGPGSGYQQIIVVGYYGPRDFNLWFIDSSPIQPAMYGSAITRGGLALDRWESYLELLQLARLNPLTTNDVRCSVVASEGTKQTTSLSDATSRYLAAMQLFTGISASQNGLGARAAVQNSPAALYNGVMKPTFKITYSDGGSETWQVSTLVPASLFYEANLPGSLKLGSGQPEPCRTTG